MEKSKTNKEINIEVLKQNVMHDLSKIKNERLKVGWTISDLSEKADVSVGIISELENSKKTDKKVPSLVNFIALARTLRLSEDFILELILGDKSSKPKKNPRIEMINTIKDYGIRDDETIDFILQTINFLKNRKKIKKS